MLLYMSQADDNADAVLLDSLLQVERGEGVSGPVFLCREGEPALFVEQGQQLFKLGLAFQVRFAEQGEAATAGGQLPSAPRADFHRAAQDVDLAVRHMADRTEIVVEVGRHIDRKGGEVRMLL